MFYRGRRLRQICSQHCTSTPNPRSIPMYKLAHPARSAAAVAVAVARRAAPDTRPLAPCFPRHEFAGETFSARLSSVCASTAAAGPRLLRRGLATLPGEALRGKLYSSVDSRMPKCPPSKAGYVVDPRAPVNPAFNLCFDEKDMASDESMWALYERWCKFYDVKRDGDEMARRFDTFKSRVHSTYEFNNSGQSWRKSLVHADWTDEELERFYATRKGMPPFILRGKRPYDLDPE